jgi:3-hydroxyisobutyrate dehydrogenase
MSKVAVLGLGKMGSGIARSLARAGHNVVVWNRSPEKWRSLGLTDLEAAATPAEAARDAAAVFSMIADDKASQRVWLANDGALSTARRGAFAIECSTISFDHVRQLSAAAERKGLTYIDCPVNGLPSMAAEGKLTLLVGASPDALIKARPLLEAIGSTIIHFGAVGTGTAFKLINNLLGAVHIASLAEAIGLAGRAGLDRAALIDAISSGPCSSPHVKRLVAPMVERRLSEVPGLSIGLREKDARYALMMARSLEFAMPVGTPAHAWYVLANGEHGAEDDSALLRTVEMRQGRLG